MDRMLALLLKFLSRLAALLPYGPAAGLARGCGGFLARVLRLRRTCVLQTLGRCFPQKTLAERQAIYVEMWRLQALNILELLRFVGGKTEELLARIEVRNMDRLEAALARGKGVLVLSAHFGNYLLQALTGPELLPCPVSIIYKPLRSAAMNRLWEDMQQNARVNGIPAGNAYRGSVQALRNRHLIGFMLDQNRPKEHGMFVDFFGRTASTSPGLAVLSARTGAPVVPFFLHRTPEGRHVLEILPMIEPPPDREEDTVFAYTTQYTRIIEEEIRKDPVQWLWIHRRWRSRPFGCPEE